MGTNYYVAKNKCECCERYDEEYHIGKASWGWAFSFHGYPWDNLKSWRQWREYLKNETIVDEYGMVIPYDEFVDMVEGFKAPGYVREDGHVNLQHNVEGRKEGYFNSEYDWDDEDGYSFSSREFS
jgi:hypothetical protein